jgi:hypothetical protein
MLICLKDSLRRVVVEFDTEELTCFQIRLVKFLVEKATILEEIVIDGGNGYDSSWIDRKVARWRIDGHRRHPVGEKEQRRMCLYCCRAGGRSSAAAPPPRTHVPIWPPSLSEFPPLENLQFSDGEDVDDDDEEEDDISPRHFMRRARENKKGGLRECFSLKPNNKGLMAARRRGGASHRRHHHSPRKAGEDTDFMSAPAMAYLLRVPATPAPEWPLSLSEFPPLGHTTSPAPFFNGKLVHTSGISTTSSCPELPPLCQLLSSEEEHDDDYAYVEDISFRYLIHSSRKKKMRSSIECFLVKPKTKASFMPTWRRGAASRPHRHLVSKEDVDATLVSPPSPLLPVRARPAPKWPPSLSEFPPLGYALPQLH